MKIASCILEACYQPTEELNDLLKFRVYQNFV